MGVLGIDMIIKNLRRVLSAILLSSMVIIAPAKAEAPFKQGWVNYSGNYYYVNSDGTYKKGWMEEDDKWYYFNEAGMMLKDTYQVINGVGYVFNSKGEWVEGDNSSYDIEDLGVYKIINVGTGKCLDVYAGQNTNGANVDIYSDNNTLAQKWKLTKTRLGCYTIQNVGSNKYLDVCGGREDNLTNVQIYEENGSLAQCWNIERMSGGCYEIWNPNGKYLDVYGGKNVDLTNVDIYENNQTNAQRWYLIKVS